MDYRVLVIEDEPILAKNIARYFNKTGCTARVAGTGRDALGALVEFRPQAVVVDANLPGELHGHQVLDHILAFDPRIKVIMMTGSGLPNVADNVAGAWEMVSKPVVLSDLKARLDRAIGKAGG